MPTVNLVREYRKLERKSLSLRGSRYRATVYTMGRIMQELERRAKHAMKGVEHGT